MSSQRQREIVKAIERLAAEAGATIAFEQTGNLSHVKVTLTYAGRSRFTVISGTPGKTYARDAILSDVRRTLRALGYVAPVKARTETEKPWRNRPPLPPSRRSHQSAAPSGPRYRPRYGSEHNAMTARSGNSENGWCHDPTPLYQARNGAMR